MKKYEKILLWLFIFTFLVFTYFQIDVSAENRGRLKAQKETQNTETIQSTTQEEKNEPEASSQSWEYVGVNVKGSTYGWYAIVEGLNNKTACGDMFQSMQLAIALPVVLTDKSYCNKPARVCHEGKCIDVVINDGGPNPIKYPDRKLDLTQGAWKALMGDTNPRIAKFDLYY